MHETADSYRITGLMSGTSLDGLDIANCQFKKEADGKWHYTIINATTIAYPEQWVERLKQLPHADGQSLVLADLELGEYMGRAAADFIRESNFRPQALASHGHTIFHQPDKKMTLQIGNGWRMALAAGIPVINDFRSLDVALGGQGAPLVPIGDRLLFADYDFCLNLGGIANLSTVRQNKSIAFDIAAANMALNYLAQKEGKTYDKGGELALQGCLSQKVLDQLNALPFYQQAPPKSLGYEWVKAEVFPLLNTTGLSTADLLHTYAHHLAEEIGQAVLPFIQNETTPKKLLVTGGGAHNTYLIQMLKQKLSPLHITVEVPEPQLVEFKEALIFAFLACLQLRGEPNSLASVTGAANDSIGGTRYEIL